MGSVNLALMVMLAAACSGARPDDAWTQADTPTDPPFRTLCNEVWTTRNLDVTTYRNGEAIPQVRDAAMWTNLTTGAWCWYNNDSVSYYTYGRLYNWYAVHDPRGLAPEGWHVLTDRDWSALEACLGDSAGYRMKQAGTSHWTIPGTAADNTSGFNGLPGGMRSDHGAFSNVGRAAVFWTSVEGSVSEAWCGRLIHHVNDHGVAEMVTGIGYMNKADGYAVRCVKDRPSPDRFSLDTAKAYEAAIAEYIKARTRPGSRFADTLYIGRHVDFPDIRLPPVIGNTAVRIVEPAEAEVLRKSEGFAYLNIFGWFTHDKIGFLVVNFGQGMRHWPDGRDDRHLYFSTAPGSGTLVLDSLRR